MYVSPARVRVHNGTGSAFLLWLMRVGIHSEWEAQNILNNFNNPYNHVSNEKRAGAQFWQAVREDNLDRLVVRAL